MGGSRAWFARNGTLSSSPDSPLLADLVILVMPWFVQRWTSVDRHVQGSLTGTCLRPERRPGAATGQTGHAARRLAHGDPHALAAGVWRPSVPWPVAGGGTGTCTRHRGWRRADLQYRAQRIALEYGGDLHRTLKRKWRQDLATREHLRDLGWTVLVLNRRRHLLAAGSLSGARTSALIERGHPDVPPCP